MAVEKPSSKGQAWFCTTGLPSDVIIEVDDMTFHLHKFPLMAKSRKLHELITEQEQNIPIPTKTTKFQTPETRRKFYNDIDIKQQHEIQEEEEEEEQQQQQNTTDDDDDDNDDEEQCHITLPGFPGGSESFETAAKFCYGVKIDLSATNAAALSCAAEYLEMTEEYSENNLVTRTERFIVQSVLKNIKSTLKTLTSCQKLMPMAEDSGIVQRCIEAIAARAATSDPSLFGWPMLNDGAVTHYRSGGNEMRKLGDSSWLDELGNLSLVVFKRLIFAMKALDISGLIIESCLIHYAKKYIPGISRAARKPSASSSSASMATEHEQRELLETIIFSLPKEKSFSRSASNATRFLFGLLRTAYILNASEACRLRLEMKIGSELEQASLDDLLIPSYSYLNETLYDVDCVERILRYFLEEMGERSGTRIEGGEDENTSARSAALMLVGKLIDGYLSEIASDANLKPEKFYDLAVCLPDHARLFDDGLYRAVDVYLKAHPWISEMDREKICGILDCQKLTLEACTHAAQNERLPLRAVVQVLFFEQLQLRNAIAGTLITGNAGAFEDAEEDDEEEIEVARAVVPHEGSTSTWRAAVRENQVLRFDMDSMRTRVHELERECTTMKKAILKIDKTPGSARREHEDKGGWKGKFGCKFKTQVCDSHEHTVVDTRKPRIHRR